MPTPTISPLPTPPNRTNAPSLFVSRADAWVAALSPFVTETNAVASYLAGLAISSGTRGADIASAATTNIAGATGDFVDVTGTTTITALGTSAAGAERTVRFTGILILTHNATSLILPTGANITTAAGDVARFRSLGSGNWVCVGYQRASGAALASSGGGGGGLVLIEKWVSTGTTGTKTFSSIPGTYTDLELRLFGRTSAATLQRANVTLNGLTTAIYDFHRLFAGPSTGRDEFAGRNSFDLIFYIHGTDAASHLLSWGEITFQGYSQTTFSKVIQSRSYEPAGSGFTGANIYGNGLCQTTAAVTSIEVTLTSGNFVSGTTIALYGRA